MAQVAGVQGHRHSSAVFTGRPPSRRLISMASSTLTTLSASRPSLRGCSSFTMQSTKCWRLESQRLVVADLGDVDVAEVQGDELAVGLELGARGGGALVVHGDLALRLHVVEHDHLLLAHHGDLAALVRVQPAHVQVPDHAALVLDVAEHHVLDVVLQVALAAGADLHRLVAGEVVEHRDVVRAEAPQGVLVGAHLAEVEPVGVGVEDLAQLAGVDELLHLGHGRVVLEQVADHELDAVLLGRVQEVLGVGGLERDGLLDERVLAGLERLLAERVVAGDRGGDDDGVQLVVGEQCA